MLALIVGSIFNVFRNRNLVFYSSSVLLLVSLISMRLKFIDTKKLELTQSEIEELDKLRNLSQIHVLQCFESYQSLPKEYQECFKYFSEKIEQIQAYQSFKDTFITTHGEAGRAFLASLQVSPLSQ